MKRFSSSFVAICLSFIMFGCGLTDLIPPDPREDMSNDPITQDWKVISYSVNGETIVIEDEDVAVNIITASKWPKFSCEDGVNCVFEINENAREGTVEKVGEEYNITFPNTDSVLKGTIDENNQLTLEIVGKTAVMVFEAKEETEEE